MKKRALLNESEPAAFKAMYQLSTFVHQSGLEQGHIHLIEIRTSQINGCAFCIDMHTRDARQHGETEQRIYALSAWDETPFYNEKERAILKLTEEVTLIRGRVSDETYTNAVNLLGESYVAKVILAVVAINGWNRIAIATNAQPVLNK